MVQVHIRNPLPFLANMGVDVAVTSEHCVESAPALLADVLSGRLVRSSSPVCCSSYTWAACGGDACRGGLRHGPVPDPWQPLEGRTDDVQ